MLKRTLLAMGRELGVGPIRQELETVESAELVDLRPSTGSQGVPHNQDCPS